MISLRYLSVLKKVQKLEGAFVWVRPICFVRPFIVLPANDLK
jgi:hypothetical protein